MSKLLLEAGTDFLTLGYGVRFLATGHSMRPAIRHAEFITVLPITADQVRVGDILLYRTDHRMFAHRVVEVIPRQGFILRGDASTVCDELVRPEQLLGKVLSVERHGTRFLLERRRSKVTDAVWMRANRMKRWAGQIRMHWKQRGTLRLRQHVRGAGNSLPLFVMSALAGWILGVFNLLFPTAG